MSFRPSIPMFFFFEFCIAGGKITVKQYFMGYFDFGSYCTNLTRSSDQISSTLRNTAHRAKYL
jgi:hypothetical protein